MTEEREIIKAKRKADTASFILYFLISFVTGILTASIVLYIYTSKIQQHPRFYTFNLSKVIQKQELSIMKHPKKNMKPQIDAYMTAVKNYVDKYAKNGIVFVTGASIGDTPYVKDITQGFFVYLKKNSQRNEKKQ